MSIIGRTAFCALVALAAQQVAACADDSTLTNPVAPSEVTALPGLAAANRASPTATTSPSAGIDAQAVMALAGDAASLGGEMRPGGSTCRHDPRNDPPGGEQSGTDWIDVRHRTARLHLRQGAHAEVVSAGGTVWGEWYTSVTGSWVNSIPVESCYLGARHNGHRRWSSACVGDIVRHGDQSPVYVHKQVIRRLKMDGFFRTRPRRRGIAVPVRLNKPGLHVVGWRRYPRHRFVRVG